MRSLLLSPCLLLAQAASRFSWAARLPCSLAVGFDLPLHVGHELRRGGVSSAGPASSRPRRRRSASKMISARVIHDPMGRCLRRQAAGTALGRRESMLSRWRDAASGGERLAYRGGGGSWSDVLDAVRTSLSCVGASRAFPEIPGGPSAPRIRDGGPLLRSGTAPAASPADWAPGSGT